MLVLCVVMTEPENEMNLDLVFCNLIKLEYWNLTEPILLTMFQTILMNLFQTNFYEANVDVRTGMGSGTFFFQTMGMETCTIVHYGILTHFHP